MTARRVRRVMLTRRKRFAGSAPSRLRQRPSSPPISGGQRPGSDDCDQAALTAEPLQHQPVQPRGKRSRILRQFTIQDLRLLEQEQAEIVDRLGAGLRLGDRARPAHGAD